MSNGGDVTRQKRLNRLDRLDRASDVRACRPDGMRHFHMRE